MTQARSWMEALTYAIRLLIAFLVVVPLYFAAVLVATVAQQRGLRIVVFANRFALSLLNITVSVESEDPPEKELSGCVFVLLNQTSLLDGTLGSVSVPLPFRAVTNIEYAMIPIVGWASTLFAYVVIRQWPAHAKRTLARIQRFLHEGGKRLHFNRGTPIG